jgi:hypothetical protein
MKLLIALYFLAASLSGQINLIVSDDCANDYCPVVAPFKLMDQGKVKILALVADSQNVQAAPRYKIYRTSYFRPTIPVFANQQNTPNNSICTAQGCNGGDWTSLLATFSDSGDTRANYTDCLTGLRTVLAGLSGTTKITETGFATCLVQLMQSPGDGITPLTGVQLIQSKVSELDVCCGVNPAGNEYNFQCDYPDWSYLFANWTTQNGYPPIWMFSFDDADGTNWGPPGYALNTVNSELKTFQNILGGVNQRPIWDEAVVFLAYCGLSCGGVTYWADAGNGTQVVNSAASTPISGQPAGYNSWSTATASGHHYVTNVASALVLSNLFDGFAYGFGFAALTPGASTGTYIQGASAVSGGVNIQ